MPFGTEGKANERDNQRKKPGKDVWTGAGKKKSIG